MLAMKRHYLFSKFWISIQRQIYWQMSFSDSASWGRTSTGELAGLFFLCIWEEDFKYKACADREEAEGGGERQPVSAKCRQPAGIAASSSWEQHLVLALVLFLLCEELQSCFFSEYIRKAVNSPSRAVPWQTLQVQSHKCFGAPAIPTSSRARRHPSGADLLRTRLAHRHSNSNPFLNPNLLLSPLHRQNSLWALVPSFWQKKNQFSNVLASYTETKTCSVYKFISAAQSIKRAACSQTITEN